MKPREASAYVHCLICGVKLRAVTWSHLVYRHYWDSRHPLKMYVRRFGIEDTASRRTRVKGRRSLIAHFVRKGRRWTADRVNREIRNLSRRGRALHSTAVEERCGSLATEARMIFGSWGKAVNAAGLNYDEVRHGRAWTRKRVIQTLQKEAGEGREVNVAAINKRDKGLYDAAIVRFGTWDRALEAAGIDPGSVRQTRKLTRNFILERIRARARQGLPVTSTAMKEDGGIVVAAWRLFGGWSRAVDAAGCANRLSKPRHWTRRELRDLFRKIYQMSGYVSSGLLAEHGVPGRVGPEYSAKKHFGSLSHAKRLLGMAEDGRCIPKRSVRIPKK